MGPRERSGLGWRDPQRRGLPAVYHWETEREPGEPWSQFVERGAADSLASAEQLPGSDDLPPDLSGRILYNICWVSEAEYENLPGRRVL